MTILTEKYQNMFLIKIIVMNDYHFATYTLNLYASVLHI